MWQLRNRVLAVILILALSLVVGACGGDDNPSPGDTNTTEPYGS